MKTLSPERYGHELFVSYDFTKSEIDRINPLAYAVVTEGRSVCKKCGEEGEALQQPCSRAFARCPRCKCSATMRWHSDMTEDQWMECVSCGYVVTL